MEDDPILQRVYTRRLNKEFDVTLAKSLSEANWHLKSRKFDVLLTDIHLTKAQKAEGLLIIGKASQECAIPKIIAMSTDPDKKDACMQFGANLFLEKPFDLELVTAVAI